MSILRAVETGECELFTSPGNGVEDFKAGRIRFEVAVLFGMQ